MIRRFTLLFIVGVVIIGGRTTSMGGDFAEVRDGTEDRTDRVRQTSLGIGYAGLRSEVDALWGPDAWGYVAKDPTSGGLAYNWYNITMTGTEFWAGQNRDDDWTGEESINRTSYIRLPFGFLFYGNHFDSISVSANAIIKFTPQSVAYWNPIPSTGYSFRIDPWVYDMYHLGGVSHYYYRGFGDSLFVVSFHDVRYCEDPYRDNPAYGKTLQVLLFRDGRIVFQYNSLMTTVPGSPFASGIDDNQGPFGLSCGNSFSNGIAITFYPPEPGIILSDPMVVPTSGGVSTEFHYHITYRNRTGAIPSIREIFIDGTPHNMEAPAGNYAAGVTFDYSPVILTPGSHNFYFYFADGTYVARSPEVGVHGGPTVYSALVGSYDIGGGNNDFPSLVAAADALRGGGAVGPVIFYIYDGSYDGQIDLPGDISGICSANPIIFQNAPGHHPTVTSTTGHGFYLTGADYITIQGLEITECLYDGIYCYYSGSDSSTYNVFSGNYIHDIGLGGNYCGIYLNRAGDTQVMGNEIDGDYNGIENHQGNRNLIANNMLYNAEYHGIRAYEGADNGYYFNSLYTDAILGMYKYNGQNTVVTNNIFYQVGSGIRYAYYVAGSVSAYPLISDYNDIYAPDAFAGYYLGNRQTLADFQAATGMDAHSISEDPLFVSIDTIMVNLHIDSSLPSPVDGRGTPIPSIEVDFDGEIRDILTPDIGADEITSLLAVGDLTIRIVSPLFQDIVLEWSAVAGTVEYKIYKSINSMTGFILIDSTASTVWMDSGVLAGDGRGLYYVIVSNTNRDHDMVSSGIQRHQTSVPRR